MAVIIGGDAAKNGKNINLLVIMGVRLLQKKGLLDLTNWTRLKNEMAKKPYKKCTQLLRNFLMLHTPSY